MEFVMLLCVAAVILQLTFLLGNSRRGARLYIVYLATFMIVASICGVLFDGITRSFPSRHEAPGWLIAMTTTSCLFGIPIALCVGLPLLVGRRGGTVRRRKPEESS